VLPLRMEADLVAKLDEARERLGLKSRMELFRRALGVYLEGAGEAEVGALFGAEG
jgi:metal-responsive CopG/Arc/MetJ family transcriptional regulator